MEADTHIMLHLKHGVLHGHGHAFVCTVDIHVPVLAVSAYHELQQLGLEDLRVGASTSATFPSIKFPTACPQKSLSLPLFHVLIGCDTSHILGCGRVDRHPFVSDIRPRDLYHMQPVAHLIGDLNVEWPFSFPHHLKVNER